MIYKKIMLKVNDFGLNILASIVVTIATQLIVYPFISQKTSVNDYGTIILIMSIINIVGVSLGNPLNNTRLLMQQKYEKEKLEGDYNLIFIWLLLISIISTFLVTYSFYKNINFTVIGIVITSSLLLFRSYYSVDYRINLNYKKNLIASVISFIGYMTGVLVFNFNFIDEWIVVFFMGELFASIYILLTVDIIKEDFKFTFLLKTSLKKYFYIFVASVFSSLSMYLDRFVIFYLINSQAVAIFTVASFLGKSVGIIAVPIANVLLSYYVKEINITIKSFCKKVLLYTVIMSIIFGCVVFLKPILTVLYPTVTPFIDELFILANLGSIIYILGNLLQPILLSYCNVKWNLIIQVLYCVFYILLSALFIEYYGLIGMCYAIILVNVFRVISIIVVVIATINNAKK